MQLKYRGSLYNYTPPQVEMEPSQMRGKYRGLDWRFRHVKKAPVQQPSLDLVYRGVPYQTGASQTEAAPKPAPSGSETSALARKLLVSHHTHIKQRQQTLLARTCAEVGLDVAASDYWAPIQGKVQSQNWNSYDRSAVAMS